jgi:hypothetical protein
MLEMIILFRNLFSKSDVEGQKVILYLIFIPFILLCHSFLDEKNKKVMLPSIIYILIG